MFKIDIENTSDLNAAIPPLKEVTENKDSKEETSEAEVKTKDQSKNIGQLFAEVEAEDLIKYGLIIYFINYRYFA